MDTFKLWFTLLCVPNVWILTMADDCDWAIQYENGGICCQACPSGEYPTKHCSENNGKSVCGKCPAASDDSRCFCTDKPLCNDNTCTECLPRPTCTPGLRLIRNGDFDYNYICMSCANGTYKDDEDGLCKSFAKCDGFRMIFAGNRTHNARCAGYEDTNAKEASKAPHIDNYYYIMMACLTITVFICLLLVMYIASRRFKRRNQKKLFQPFTYKVALPSDACNCKLSKEEKGDDESDSKTTLELSLKCESLIP
ncbi:tumor necrosis factor receptor superfamily member 18 isoform X1 [Triplophysa dalaica]|uniref:tumor necrosis factor receptor superfamily member 18 isoform X1 n=1 Tax=Triplophysa dalaica TaxID=1582913 RepID=UPI0024DF83FC|nr:tumor necrosis factor receptor superfamily member 18 isoform X1 [Triplophysa dalaica]